MKKLLTCLFACAALRAPSLYFLSALTRTIVFCVASFFVGQELGASDLKAGDLPAAPEGTFSIVVIPDTQHYKGLDTKSEPKSKDPLSNETFSKWTDWVAANLANQKIVFVSHVGDIVDKNNREQWALAKACMDKIHGKVPYGISVGNHDMSNGSGDSSLFQEVLILQAQDTIRKNIFANRILDSHRSLTEELAKISIILCLACFCQLA